MCNMSSHYLRFGLRHLFGSFSCLTLSLLFWGCGEPIAEEVNAVVDESSREEEATLEDGLVVAHSLIMQNRFLEASTVLEYLKVTYPSDRTVAELITLVNAKLESAWELAVAQSDEVSTPIMREELPPVLQLKWMLIEKSWNALQQIPEQELGFACLSILKDLNELLEAAPNFWDGRFLQAILALGVGDDASGRAAVSWMERWGALPQLEPAYRAAYEQRGWLVSEAKSHAESVTSVVEKERDFAAEMAAMLSDKNEVVMPETTVAAEEAPLPVDQLKAILKAQAQASAE